MYLLLKKNLLLNRQKWILEIKQLFLRTLFLSFLFCIKAYALEIAPLTSPVIDEVGIINAQTKANLESKLRAVNAREAGQIQVYVIRSLAGLTIEEASIQIADTWKLGSVKQDNGILFLIAPNERKMRIEVGQGLEGQLPDIQAKRIIADIVTPEFRRGDFSTGVARGVNAIISFIAPDLVDDTIQSYGDQQEHNVSDNSVNPLVVLLFFILLLPLMAFGRRRSGRYWSSGGGYWGGSGGGGFGGGSFGGGGGGWSGGGGGFSGGGASGNW